MTVDLSRFPEVPADARALLEGLGMENADLVTAYCNWLGYRWGSDAIRVEQAFQIYAPEKIEGWHRND